MSLSADLSGTVVLVTGASSGLGRHFARVLARHRATVIAAGRRASLLDDVVKEIVANGGDARPLVLDLCASADELQLTVTHAIGYFGRVDVLVNNAGVAISKSMLEQTQSDWDQVVNTNVRGAFFIAQAVARYMRDAGSGGSIVNVASILGLRQAGGVAPYAASKAALVQLTKVLALELSRYSIRVNAIAPGYIETDLNAEFFRSQAGQKLIDRIPQRRLGRPDDLDGVLLLLCSEASRYMTGSILTVDGGHLVSTL